MSGTSSPAGSRGRSGSPAKRRKCGRCGSWRNESRPKNRPRWTFSISRARRQDGAALSDRRGDRGAARRDLYRADFDRRKIGGRNHSLVLRPRLFRDGFRFHGRAEMREEERPRPGVARDPGRLDTGGMAPLVRERRTRMLVSRFVEEDVREAPENDRPLAGNAIEYVRDHGSAARRADESAGMDPLSRGQLDGPPRLQLRHERAARDAGGRGGVRVEASRPIGQRYSVAEGRHPVHERMEDHMEHAYGSERPVEGGGSRTGKLDHLERHVARPDRSRLPQHLEDTRDSPGPDDHDGPLAALQAESAEEAGQAVEVVAMEVRDEDGVEPGE